MSTKSTHTDPRVIRTRQLIRDAFIDLLQEMEVDKITVNRIAERATINRVTFYLHYRDIPDMLERMADDMANNLEAIMTINSKLPETREMNWVIVVKMLEHIAENKNFYKVLLASKRIPIFTERLQKLMVDVISDKIEQREVRGTKIPKDIATWYGTSVFLGMITFWLRNDLPYSPHFLANQFSLLVPISPNFDLPADSDSYM